MSIALIDADVICYRAAFAVTTKVDWHGDGDMAEMADPKEARAKADELVAEWTKNAGCKRHLLVFSDRSGPKTSFRYHICPIYKSTRPEDRPAMHDVVFEHLQKRYQHVWYSGLEGDDTLGIMASGEEGSKYIVVSIDKDLLTVPGRHFNPDHPETPPHKVSVHVANYNWLYQTIAGDAVDNYKGAPGAGKVAATKALAGCADAHEMWENVLEVFAAQFDTERWRPKFLTDSPWDEAIMNAQCARILRWGEYNKRDKLVKLWHPDNDNQWISPF